MRHVLFSLRLVVGAFATVSSLQAPAQTYPSQDLHFICGFPPGSGADVLVRYYAEQIRSLVGRTVIVENKPGASGQIAAGVAPAVSLALYKT